MAENLGALFYTLNIRDLTDADLQRINKKLKNLGLEIDTKKFLNSLDKALESYKGKDLALKVDKQILHDAIRDSLKNQTFPISVRVEAASAQQAVRDALQHAGLQRGFTAADKRQHEAETKRMAAMQVAAAKAALAESKAAAANALAQQRLASAHRTVRRATDSHIHSSISLGSAMRGNIRIAGELGPMLASAYSVVALKNFMTKVVEIGGELEKQKLAMKAILGDEGMANTISSQINSLAVKSPFGVLELNQYAKQLTAFQIPYNELFDTMKRLADISAATGTDMGRIILAFGQIRSATVLKGTEARQLTEANIPIFKMLSDYYSELEARTVSVGEVMDRMSEKKIPFEDVKNVLWELTNEGGRFYNMQEELSESLQAKWKNLGDALDLMYADIAKSTSGPLKGLAELLTELTTNWGTVATVIATVGPLFGLAKVATLAWNAALSKTTISAIAEAKSSKQLESANLRVASTYRTLTAAEQGLIRTKGRLTAAQYVQLAAEGKLTKEQALRLIALKRLDTNTIGHLRNVLNISKQEVAAAQSAKAWRVRLEQLKVSLAGFGRTIASAFLNPMSIAMAAASAWTVLWQRHSEEMQKAREIGENLFTKATEGAKNLSKAVEGIKPAKGLTDLELTQGIEQMEAAIKDYSAKPINDMNESLVAQDGHLLTLAERYEVLKKKVDEILASYREISKTGNNGDAASMVTGAIESTNSFVGGGLLEYAKDYTEALKKQDQQILSFLKQAHSDIEKEVEGAMKHDKSFAEVCTRLETTEARFTELVKNRAKYFDAYKSFINGYARLVDGVAGDREDFLSKVDEFAKALEINIKRIWNVSVGEMTGDQKNALVVALNTMINEAEGVSDVVKAEWRKILENTFSIEFDPEIDAASLISREFANNIENYLGKSTAEAVRKGVMLKGADLAKAQKGVADAAVAIAGGADSVVREALNESISENKLAQTTGLVLNSIVNKFKLANANKDGDSQSNKDTVAENLRQRFKDVKDAWNEFQKWSKTEGRDAAAKRIGDSGIFSTLSADEIPQTVEQYRALVKQIEDELRKAGVKGTKRESLLNELLKQLLDIDKTVVDEQLSVALDKISKEAERQLADWKLFDKIHKATGNQNLAMGIAFGMNPNAETDYVQLMKNKFNAIAKASGSKFTYGIATPELLQKEGIQEVQKAYEQAYGEINKYHQKEREDVADILAKYQSLQDKLGKIDYDRDEEIRKVNASDLTPGQKVQAIQRINTEADYKKFTQSNEYLQFFAGIYALTNQEATRIGDLIEQNLNKRLQAGTISAEDYYKEIERIRQQLDKLRNVKSDAMTFMTGGVNGLNDKRMETNDAARLESIQKIQKIEKELAEAKAEVKGIDDAEGQGKVMQLQNQLNLAKQELYVQNKIRDKLIKNKETWQSVLDVANIASGIASVMSDAFNSIKDMASAFGADTDSGAWADIGAVMDTLTAVTGGVQKVVQSAMSGDIGGILGGVVSTITTPFTIWATLHDKKLQKMIERSKEAAQIMQNQYDILEKQMAYFLGNAANMNVEGYDGKGGAYGKQLELMKGQLAELEKQRQAEIDKKKTDNSVVEDYNKQIEEMKISIRAFAGEVAKDIYGIDLKGWAKQLGDALFEAWKRGENGAEAFKKKASEIVGAVLNNIFRLKVLEPMMEQLAKDLFGEDGQGGIFGKDFELTSNEVLDYVVDNLMEIGDAAKQYSEFMDEANRRYKEKTGQSLKDDESKSGLSAGIQSITEGTADLLASYVNSIRAYVAEIVAGRIAVSEDIRLIAQDVLPRLNTIAESQLRVQEQIAANTLANAKAAQDIYNLLNRNIIGANKFHI